MSYYVIDEFLDAPLSNAALDALTADLQVVRQAGLKMIPRFTYNFPCADSLEAELVDDCDELAAKLRIGLVDPPLVTLNVVRDAN